MVQGDDDTHLPGRRGESLLLLQTHEQTAGHLQRISKKIRLFRGTRLLWQFEHIARRVETALEWRLVSSRSASLAIFRLARMKVVCSFWDDAPVLISLRMGPADFLVRGDSLNVMSGVGGAWGRGVKRAFCLLRVSSD